MSLPNRPPFKLETVLMMFIEYGHSGMNQLEACKEYGESCLHTSVSTLYNQHGIIFKRKQENIKNRVGTTSRFTRYWFFSERDERKAENLINSFRKRRGLAPLLWGEEKLN